MKLPKRGFLVNGDGQVVWAWEHTNEDTDFNSLPPFSLKLDTKEARPMADLGATVVDLDDEGLGPGELGEMLSDLHSIIFRRTKEGKISMRKKVKVRLPREEGYRLRLRTATEPQPEEVEMEMDHPLVALLNAKRSLANKPLLETGDNVRIERGIK